MIKGEHCKICESELICNEFNPADSYCKDVEAKYKGRQAAKKLKVVLDECIEKMKEISSTYNIRYFIVLHAFISGLEDEFTNELLGDDEDVKDND